VVDPAAVADPTAAKWIVPGDRRAAVHVAGSSYFYARFHFRIPPGV